MPDRIPLQPSSNLMYALRQTLRSDLDLWPQGMSAAVGEAAEAPEVNDTDLVQDALAGDEDSFSAIVVRYQRKAFWIAFHVLGRVEDARDVTQEAFVRVYRSLHKFDFGRNFYTWFYRIVMNLAIDQLRKNRSARAASLDNFGDGLAGTHETSMPAERKETRVMVWHVLDRLDDKFKSVLVLRDIHGMSCREIAPILKVTHATVRWRLHRGRQIFRDHWERMGRSVGA